MRWDLPEEQAAAGTSRERWLLGQVQAQRSSRTPPAANDVLTRFDSEIHSIYLGNRDQAFVILRDHAVSTANCQCVAEVRAHFADQGATAVFLTKTLFAYMMRYLNPFNYSWFVQHSTLVFGDGFLAEIGRPPPAALKLDLLKQVPLLLMWVQSRAFIRPGWRDPFRPDEIELNLDRALALEHFLVSGEVHQSIAAMVEAYIAANPDDMTEIRGLRKSLQEMPEMPSPRAWFFLMRRLQDDIHAALSSDDCWEIIDEPAIGQG